MPPPVGDMECPCILAVPDRHFNVPRWRGKFLNENQLRGWFLEIIPTSTPCRTSTLLHNLPCTSTLPHNHPINSAPPLKHFFNASSKILTMRTSLTSAMLRATYICGAAPVRVSRCSRRKKYCTGCLRSRAPQMFHPPVARRNICLTAFYAYARWQKRCARRCTNC